jgi:hypothetical protein
MKKLLLIFGFIFLVFWIAWGWVNLRPHAQMAGTSISNGNGVPSGACISGSAYTDSSTGNQWSCTASLWKLVSTPANISCTTGSIGGGLLAVGGSASGTATCTGATTAMVCEAQASDGTNMPALGAIPNCTVTSADTVTVNVVAIVVLTPGAKTYNVRVIP